MSTNTNVKFDFRVYTEVKQDELKQYGYNISKNGNLSFLEHKDGSRVRLTPSLFDRQFFTTSNDIEVRPVSLKNWDISYRNGQYEYPYHIEVKAYNEEKISPWRTDKVFTYQGRNYIIPWEYAQGVLTPHFFYTKTPQFEDQYSIRYDSHGYREITNEELTSFEKNGKCCIENKGNTTWFKRPDGYRKRLQSDKKYVFVTYIMDMFKRVEQIEANDWEKVFKPISSINIRDYNKDEFSPIDTDFQFHTKVGERYFLIPGDFVDLKEPLWFYNEEEE